jgi:hypothetical protein
MSHSKKNPDGGFRIRLAKNINEKQIIKLMGFWINFPGGVNIYGMYSVCSGGFSLIAVNIIFFKRQKNGLPFV